jgi:hypothetical protein
VVVVVVEIVQEVVHLVVLVAVEVITQLQADQEQLVKVLLEVMAHSLNQVAVAVLVPLVLQQ